MPTPSPAARAVGEDVELLLVSVGLGVADVDCVAKLAALIVVAL